MLPDEAKKNKAWVQPPPLAAGLKQYRESLRKALLAAEGRVRAIRGLPEPDKRRLDQAEREYAAIHCQVIMAKDPEMRQERQEAFVNKAKKTLNTMKDAELAAQMKLKAAEVDTEKAKKDLHHAQQFLSQMQQMSDFCAYVPPKADEASKGSAKAAPWPPAGSDSDDGDEISSIAHDPYGNDESATMEDDAEMSGRSAWASSSASAPAQAKQQSRMAKMETNMAELKEHMMLLMATMGNQQAPAAAAPSPAKAPEEAAGAGEAQAAQQAEKKAKEEKKKKAAEEAKAKAAAASRAQLRSSFQAARPSAEAEEEAAGGRRAERSRSPAAESKDAAPAAPAADEAGAAAGDADI